MAEWSGKTLNYAEALANAPALPCPECHGSLRLRPSKHGFFYGCSRYPHCRATHGAHPDGAPKGVPGTKADRRARMLAHQEFDKLWRLPGLLKGESEGYRRKSAYGAFRSDLPHLPLHIAEMNEAQALELVEWAQNFVPRTR